VKLEFALFRTSLVTVRTVSLIHDFMTTRIRFKFIWIAEIWIYIYVDIVFKVRCRKTCFRRDRPKSSVTFSFMDSDLRLCFFLSCIPFVSGCQFCTSVLASTCGFGLLSPDFRPSFVFRIMSYELLWEQG